MRRATPRGLFVGLFLLPQVAESHLHGKQPHPVLFKKPRAPGSWAYAQEQMYEGPAPCFGLGFN